MPTNEIPYHLDYESKSLCDLIKFGAYRYANDPSTQIIMCAIARGNEAPLLWVHPDYDPLGIYSDAGAWELIAEAFANPNAIIFAHNAQFEIALSHYRALKDMGLNPPERTVWRCTQAMARLSALRPRLEHVAQDLGLPEQKDKAGKALINLFSKPKKDTTHIIHPSEDPKKYGEKFAQFCAYCKQDVMTERAVEQKLKVFQLKGQVLKIFQADIEINHRGLPVNVQALDNAQAMIDEVFGEYDSQFQAVTGLRTTQTKKCLEWFTARGYPYKNMQATTVEKALKGKWGTKKTRHMLFLRKELSYAAVKKVTSMRGCVCDDGYVRGTIQFHGARTLRWSGRLIQPQNFKRPTFKNTALAYKMICEGESRGAIELLFGNIFEVISSCIRHFMQPHPKKVYVAMEDKQKDTLQHVPYYEPQEFFDADYAGIEARIVCWLADQLDALEDFENGADLYIKLATKIFGCDYDEQIKLRDAGENTLERFVGKQARLGCGFQMGGEKFMGTCENYGVKIDRKLAFKAVRTFRTENSKIADLWWTIDKAIKDAIKNKGKTFWAGTKLLFAVVKRNGIEYLVMKLPSGRSMVYPHPKLKWAEKTFKMEDGTKKTSRVETIRFYGKPPMSEVWSYECELYGGLVLENATQATAFDIMGNGLLNAEAKGYRTATLIHDQGLAYKDNDSQTIEEFCDLLCDLPEWAAGMPIVAEGKVVPYYSK